MQRVRLIAQRILDGRLSPEFGARAIWELTADDPTLNSNHLLDDFIFAASEWDAERWSAVVVRRAKAILDA